MKRNGFGRLQICATSFCGLFFYLTAPSLAAADSSTVPDNDVAPYTVQLTATVQETPPSITLSWPHEASSTIASYNVYRKTATSTNWGAPRASILPASSSYTDISVATGTTYEYRVIKSSSGVIGYGYIYSGINVPLQDTRGKIILIVDDSESSPLSSELTRLQQDLANEGWTVIRHDVASTSSVTSVKNLIINDYQTDPTNVKQVFLFGRIPVPYSGSIGWDGHSDHNGAWPADVYYGSMTGTWTDSTVNVSSGLSTRTQNIPGDGKFDQSILPAAITLAVGRVDMSNLPAFIGKSETDLLRQYLNKDHEYRIKGNIVPLNQGLVAGNFGSFDGEAFSGAGWMNFSVLVGGTNIISTNSSPNYSYLEQLASTSFLWAEGDGAGTYTSAYGGIASTNDFASTTPHAVFNMLFGSYFGDWDSTDNFLRAPLASAGWGLTSVWSGRPWWIFDHMGLGETIGYDMLTTVNNLSGTYFSNYPNGGTHEALMGDPTLRMYVMAPPSGITSSSTERRTDLSWTASSDSNIAGYHVYRSSSQYGPYIRVTSVPVVGTTYQANATTSGSYYYMARAVRLETTPSGTFWNASPGVSIGPLSITVINTPPTLAPIIDQTGYINATTSITFTVGDGESNLPQLLVSATSSNSAIASSTNITLSGSTASRTLTVRPPNHTTGSTTITISVSDGQATTSQSFVLTVVSIPDSVAPSIPTSVVGSNMTTSSIHLTWSTSIDVGSSTGEVSGFNYYKIYRDGIAVATSTQTSYDDTGLLAGTSYSYGIAAVDIATNESGQSTTTHISTISNSVTSSGGGGGGGGGGGAYTYVQPVNTLNVTPATSVVPSAPLPVTPTVSPTQPFTQPISPGSAGAQVLALQKMLASLGFLTATPNGYFGPATKAAVTAYQLAHKLPGVGSVGPLTLSLLNTSLKTLTQTPTQISPIATPSVAPISNLLFTRDLTVGSRGNDVLALQKFLNKNGYIVSGTGIGSPGSETILFGEKTGAAMTLFQIDHSITPADGQLRGQTRTLINSLY